QDYGAVTPVIEGDAVWMASDGSPDIASLTPASGDAAPQVLRVLGIDILTDLAFRDYAFTNREPRDETTRDLLSLLSDTDAVVLTESFAAPRGLKVGSPVRLLMGDTPKEFHVRALLKDRGPARALGGNLVVMDIAAAQVALGRIGHIDRLEVRV